MNSEIEILPDIPEIDSTPLLTEPTEIPEYTTAGKEICEYYSPKNMKALYYEKTYREKYESDPKNKELSFPIFCKKAAKEDKINRITSIRLYHSKLATNIDEFINKSSRGDFQYFNRRIISFNVDYDAYMKLIKKNPRIISNILRSPVVVPELKFMIKNLIVNSFLSDEIENDFLCYLSDFKVDDKVAFPMNYYIVKKVKTLQIISKHIPDALKKINIIGTFRECDNVVSVFKILSKTETYQTIEARIEIINRIFNYKPPVLIPKYSMSKTRGKNKKIAIPKTGGTQQQIDKAIAFIKNAFTASDKRKICIELWYNDYVQVFHPEKEAMALESTNYHFKKHTDLYYKFGNTLLDLFNRAGINPEDHMEIHAINTLCTSKTKFNIRIVDAVTSSGLEYKYVTSL